MKVAVIIYGAYRELDINYKTWHFLNELDCDVYTSIWDNEMKESSRLNTVHSRENITKEDVNKFLPNANITVHNQREYNLKVYGYEQEFYSHDKNSSKVFFHWKFCLDKIKKSGIKYDYILLNRTDSYVVYDKPFSELLDFNQDDVLYVRSNCRRPTLYKFENNWTCDDIIVWGKCETVSKMIDGIEFEKNMNIHFDFGDYLHDNNVTIVNIEKLEIWTTRPNIRTINENEITPQIIEQKMQEWG